MSLDTRRWSARRRTTSLVAVGALSIAAALAPQALMRWLLRWARPGAHPWIAMGPHDYLVQL